MDPIRWEDPPEKQTHRGIWIERLTPLMDHPKRWAIIRVHQSLSAARSLVSQLNAHEVHIPAGRWEFTSRTVNGEPRVYGRYLGPDEEAAP